MLKYQNIMSPDVIDNNMRINQEASTISKECLVKAGNIPRCIDDRFLIQGILEGNLPDYVVRPENSNGSQFLGGSLGVFALVAESMVLENPDIELNFDDVYTKTVELHQKAGLQIGVHMDNHHGHLTVEQVKETLEKIPTGKLGEPSVIPGCGFAGLLSDESNPLGLSPKVSTFFINNENVVDELVRRGAKLSILSGNHAEKVNAMAIDNMNPERTLSTEKAIEKGVQAYGHDTGKLWELMMPLGEPLSNKIMEINQKWLKVTTNILAGMDPVQLPDFTAV